MFSRSCSASFRSVPFSVPVPPQERNGRTERNGTISVLGGTERNDENRRNDETGRSVPKLALQEKWMENPLKCVKNPNFFACGAYRHRRRYILKISFKGIKRKNFKKMIKIWNNGCTQLTLYILIKCIYRKNGLNTNYHLM